MTPSSPPLLRFEDVGKGFAGIPVLRSVHCEVHAGRITGLVGENGAGKSTLMNLLGGIHAPDAGTIFLGQTPHRPRSPAAARAAGIAFVHQELNLFPNLSVAENLAIDDLPVRHPFGLIDQGRLAARARDLLQRVGLALPPDTLLEHLPAGERQLIEIARALGIHARILILDEPTTSLTTRETERLFSLMRRLRSDGLAIIFISHALGDVLRESDDLVVLRDGAVSAQGPASSFSLPRLVTAMVGRELTQLFPPREPIATASDAAIPRPTPRLAVRALSQPGVVHNVSFDLLPGEILGLAGLMGAGRSELARILFGLDPHEQGAILLDGSPLPSGPVQSLRHGVAFLTEDRRTDGLCLDAAVADNIALVTLRDHARAPIRWIDTPRLTHAIQSIREAVRINPGARNEQAVRTLSGGNQQKVVLAKWLLARPRLLILDEPTRGIDVGARFEIYQLIRGLAAGGAGILLISSELEELLGLCDRILVMAQGRITDHLERPEFDQERILRAALPD